MTADQKEINLITLAAGMGTRTVKRSIIPKPFQNVKGNAIIEWSLKSYQYLINKRIIKQFNMPKRGLNSPQLIIEIEKEK